MSERIDWHMVARRAGPDGSIREAVSRLPDGACVWCGGATPMRALTPFRPDLGSVPLHIICGSDMREAFEAWRDGVPLDPKQLAGVARLTAPEGPQTLQEGQGGPEREGEVE